MDYRTLIERNMTNHTPSADCQAEMSDLRRHFHAVGTAVLAGVPDGREKSLAVTQLEQALMWCMAAMARDDYDQGSERFDAALSNDPDDHTGHCHSSMPTASSDRLSVTVLCCRPKKHTDDHSSCIDAAHDHGRGCYAWR